MYSYEQGVWSSGCCGADEAEPTDDMRMLMSSQEGAEGHAHADEGADQGGSVPAASSQSIPAKSHVQVDDCDDMMASVLGHMSEVGELDNMSSLAWPSQVQHHSYCTCVRILLYMCSHTSKYTGITAA